jgi:hypothetical protein
MGLIAAEGYLKVQFLRKKGVIIDLTPVFYVMTTSES